VSGSVEGATEPFAARLSALVARNASARPDAPAVTDDAGTLTWAGFAERVAGFSKQLAALGVERGSLVALWLPNGGDYLVAIFAVARRGAVAVHVNTRFGAAEVGDLLDRSGAAVLVTRSRFAPVDFLGLLGRVQLARLRTVLCFGPAPRSVGGLPVVAARCDGTAPDLSEPDAPCLTYTTGGTTARPKLVVHNQRSIARHGGEVRDRIGIARDGAALLAVVPFCGTFGNAAAMAAVAGGAHIVCMDAFDPDRADALIRRHRVSHLVGDDRMLDRLAASALDGAGPHDSIEFFGTAAFSPEAEQACRLGVRAGLRPVAIYGSSEVQALFAIGDPAKEGWGAVMPVSPDAEFDVAGPDRGELRIRAPSLFEGYLDDPAATEAAKSADGWFRTGDLAEREGGGFIFHGRTGDVLRLGGFLVSPLEIEAFLQLQPGVAAAQVVGVETARGTAAFAFILPTPDAVVDEADLLRTCRESLARHKVPVRAVPVDYFPTSNGPNGPKISRAELRRQAQATLSQPSEKETACTSASS